MFDILSLAKKDGVDVRMVVWQPAMGTADTIPDPSPTGIPGVNEGGSIQAAGIKLRVIAAGIGRLMVISNLSIWISLRN